MKAYFARYSPALLSLLRLVAGLLFFEHGLSKIFGFPPDPAHAVANFYSLAGAAAILEFAGGFLLAIGLFTRATAFILSGFMAVAYFMVHSPQGFFPLINGGELAVLYCFLFLYFAAAGGGPYSLDAFLRRSA